MHQQMLDVSQAHFLAYGHKSLVVQLGVQDAVYKAQCMHAPLSLVLICSQGIHRFLLDLLCDGCGTLPLSIWRYELQLHTINWFRMKS